MCVCSYSDWGMFCFFFFLFSLFLSQRDQIYSKYSWSDIVECQMESDFKWDQIDNFFLPEWKDCTEKKHNEKPSQQVSALQRNFFCEQNKDIVNMPLVLLCVHTLLMQCFECYWSIIILQYLHLPASIYWMLSCDHLLPAIPADLVRLKKNDSTILDKWVLWKIYSTNTEVITIITLNSTYKQLYIITQTFYSAFVYCLHSMCD